jgi:hypothetical protein
LEDKTSLKKYIVGLLLIHDPKIGQERGHRGLRKAALESYLDLTIGSWQMLFCLPLSSISSTDSIDDVE